MNYGKIRISTNPSGATVRVNSQDKGTTPIDIVNVDPGTYNITLSYPGKGEENLSSYNFNIVVIDGKMTDVKFNFVLQEVTEEHIVLTDVDLVRIEVPPRLPEEISPSGSTPTSPVSEIPVNGGMSERYLTEINQTLFEIKQYTAKQYGFDKEEKHFNLDRTAITVATPNKPENPDIIANATTGTPGYDRVPVYDVFHRNSRSLVATNDGSSDLFVIISNDGKNFKAAETIIKKGVNRTFLNVYELRIRSPVAGSLSPAVGQSPGGIYRISEYEEKFSYNNLNKPDIGILTTLNPFVLGAGYVVYNITGDIFNLPIVFRSCVTNAGLTYIARTAAGLLNVAGRIILNPGDVVKLNITKGAQIFFGGSVANQLIELLNEAD